MVYSYETEIRVYESKLPGKLTYDHVGNVPFSVARRSFPTRSETPRGKKAMLCQFHFRGPGQMVFYRSLPLSMVVLSRLVMITYYCRNWFSGFRRDLGDIAFQRLTSHIFYNVRKEPHITNIFAKLIYLKIEISEIPIDRRAFNP